MSQIEHYKHVSAEFAEWLFDFTLFNKGSESMKPLWIFRGRPRTTEEMFDEFVLQKQKIAE